MEHLKFDYKRAVMNAFGVQEESVQFYPIERFSPGGKEIQAIKDQFDTQYREQVGTIAYLEYHYPGVSLNQCLVNLIKRYLEVNPARRGQIPKPNVNDGWSCGAYDLIQELKHIIRNG